MTIFVGVAVLDISIYCVIGVVSIGIVLLEKVGGLDIVSADVCPGWRVIEVAPIAAKGREAICHSVVDIGILVVSAVAI